MPLVDQFHLHLDKMTVPSATWKDLIDALAAPDLITRDAALILHDKLGVRRNARTVNRSSEFWQGCLRERGIFLRDAVKPLQ